ncbi:synaptotagmin-like protein 1 isoform X2 [Lissotriton helveticus]
MRQPQRSGWSLRVKGASPDMIALNWKLRQTVSDPTQLKFLTGDWFCDVRAKRHRGKKFGSDIVQASIRRKKKPKGEREKGPWPAEVSATADESVDQSPDKLEPRASNKVVPEPVLPQSTKPQEVTISMPLVNGEKKEASLENQGPAQPQTAGGAPDAEEEIAPPLPPKDGREQEREEVLLSPVIITVQSDEELDNEKRSSLTSKNNNALNTHHIPLKTSSSMRSLGSTTLNGSVMSLYSDGEFGSVEVRGCIQFSLQFDTRKKELMVIIIQCRDLAEAKKQRSDPYVKTYLLPDKSSASKRKTAVKKRCLEPLFNETLKYKIDKPDLQSRILNLSVWHHDSLGRNLFMGEVEIELSSWDWSQTQPVWFNLQPRTPVSSGELCSRGKLVLSLKFIPPGSEGSDLPPTGELHIWVKEAQNLLPIRTGTIDSFVKCFMLPDESKSSRQKTRVIKKSLNPTFNHTMVYDGFRAEDLQEACAEFTVWDHEAFSSQQIGGLRLSMGKGSSYGLPVHWMDSTEEEKHVWKTVMEKPNQWVDVSLPLRTNLTPRV